MKLTVFNGSPRGTDSNTRILLEHFLTGFSETQGNEFEIIYLIHTDRQEEFVKKFREAEAVVMAFPLYTDSMPGIVKEFIESLSPFRGLNDNPPIGFIVQSGFYEPVHTSNLRLYLKKLAQRLNSPLLGMVSRGNIEGIQVQPPLMTKKLFGLFHDLGKGFGETGKFDPTTTGKLIKRENLSFTGRLALKIVLMLKISDTYWNQKLKHNNAFGKRYDKPYSD